jgi:hypothetical protein
MLKQVLAVGSFWSSLMSMLEMQNLGSMYRNPINGGLGQLVTNFNTKLYSGGDISSTAFQKYLTTLLFLEKLPIYFVYFIHSQISMH